MVTISQMPYIYRFFIVNKSKYPRRFTNNTNKIKKISTQPRLKHCQENTIETKYAQQ